MIEAAIVAATPPNQNGYGCFLAGPSPLGFPVVGAIGAMIPCWPTDGLDDEDIVTGVLCVELVQVERRFF